MPSDSFVFNPRATADNPLVNEKRKRLSDLQNQIDDLKTRVTVNEQPLFASLLKFCFNSETDWKEARVLGRALVKWAEMQPELKELQDQVALVDLVKANTHWMAAAFADSSDIPEEFERLLQGDDEL